jgi:hypothetical protein
MDHKLVVAVAGLSLAPAAFAQEQLIHHVGDRWILSLADPSLVDPSLIGQKVYFPVTTARRIGLRVHIGGAAICEGKYSGSPAGGLVSVEGRVARLVPSEATFTNTRREVYRHATTVYLLRGCKFGPIDRNEVPN